MQPGEDGLRRFAKRGRESLREINLKDIAGGDVVDRPLHGTFISIAREVGAKLSRGGWITLAGKNRSEWNRPAIQKF